MHNTLWIVALAVLGAGILAIELGISPAITEILAGVVVGSVLDFQPGQYLESLASLGILTLMYVAGLEIDLDLMRNRFRESVTIGFSSFALPFTSVTIIARYALHFTSMQSLLIGIALSTTSIAIVFPYLRMQGPLSETSKGILAAAMVADLTSMLMLSILFTEISKNAVILVGLIIVLTLLIPKMGKRIFSHFHGNAVEFEFRIILFIIIGLAIASEEAGVEAALVAFLLGMITSGVVVGHSDLQEKFQAMVFGFLAPIFFFWVGLTVSFSEIASNIGMISILFVLCYSTKFIGTYFPSRKFYPKIALEIGFLFNNRLSLGLVAALYGRESGLLSDKVYASLVGCILMTTFISTALLKRKKHGRWTKKKK